MFGQSAFAAFFASGVTKRVSYLSLTCMGYERSEADKISDELSISAAQGAGTVVSILTVDPAGMAGTVAYSAMLEKEMSLKQNLMKR